MSIKVVDGSIRTFAPNHSGSLVAHIQELEFATDVVGDSCDSSFHLNASSLSFLALDDFSKQDSFIDSRRTLRGVLAWTVHISLHFSVYISQLIFLQASGYALFIEMPELDVLFINHLNSSPEWKVRLGCHCCVFSLTICSLGRCPSYFSTTAHMCGYAHGSWISDIGPE